MPRNTGCYVLPLIIVSFIFGPEYGELRAQERPLGPSLLVLDEASQGPLSEVQVALYDSTGTLMATRFTDTDGRVALDAGQPVEEVGLFHAGYAPRRIDRARLRQSDFRVMLSSQALSLEGVVVSANRWEQDQANIPVHIAKMTAAEIRYQNPQTTADLLGATDQVFIQKSQLGGGSPMMRGFATNRVLLVVDGVRMNNAIFRSGNLQNVISLDAQSVQSAEVLFGPGSVIYGSDALGGVMDFHTHSAFTSGQDSLFVEGSAMSRFTSASRALNGHSHVHLGGARWGSVTSVSYSQYGDLRMGRHGPDAYLRRSYVDRVNGEDVIRTNPEPRRQRPTGFDQTYVLQKLKYRLNDRWTIAYHGHWSEVGETPRYDRLIARDDAGRLANAEWYYGPQKWQMHSLRGLQEAERGPYDRIKIIGAYQFYEESRFDRDFGDPDLRRRTEQLDIFSLNLDAEKSLDARWQLFYGLEAVQNKVSSQAYRAPIDSDGPRREISTRYPDGAQWRSLGAYATSQWDPRDHLSLHGGLRYSQIALNAPFDRRFFDFPFDEIDLQTGALTGSLGAVWRLPGAWRIAPNLSTGFRAPNVDDAGKIFDSEPGNVVVPNPNLRSEYLYSSELRIEKVFQKRLKLSATGFYSRLEDAMVRRPYTFGGEDSIVYDGALSEVEALQNEASATLWGVQAQARYQMFPAWMLEAAYNITEGATDDGEPVRHVAPHFGNIRLRWKPQHPFRASVEFTYSGKIEAGALAPSERGKPNIYLTNELGQLYSPAWYRVDARVAYLLDENVSFNGGVENLTDQRYRPYSSGIAAPGRNFVLAVHIRF